MTRTCPHCGSSDIDEDAARGDATCMACGTVLEESIVVSENQFQERAGGSGHTLVGQFVSAERAQSQARSGGLVSQESREVTFAKGRKLIEEIASQLRINQHCIDTAYNFFKMSVSRNLTRGRVRSHVVVACLYMTCRLENTAHLLLDFSDVTQVNVFDLGRTLSFLSRSLRINLPSTDPCLYVMRFACLLEFGDKQKEVVNLATRLVQRMKRDWMSTGRRPTGLCGAALLLAARSFNFNRTIGDVVKVVHISETVVRKRLEEFSQTPSGMLTIDEFSTIDLEHCEDPPAFREARRKAREEQLAKEAEMAARMEKEIIPIEEELERALEKKRREKFKQTRYAKIVAGDLEDSEVGTAEEALLRDEVVDTVFRAVDEEEEERSNETNSYSKYAPSLQSLGITQAPANGIARTYAPLPAQDTPDGSLDLTGIDDDEIDTYILTTRESEMKERFWMKLNGEHLKEMERRRKEREEEEEREKDNPTKKKRRRPVPQRKSLSSNTAIEAMEKIIHEKKLSNKVNYDILKEIEQTASGVDGLERVKSQVIENVNELVSTLGMDKMMSESASPTLSRVITSPITPENMTRREREISRRNKPLKDPSALKVALKIESTMTNETDSQSQDFKKPIPLSRARYGRLVRPNLATAGLHRSAVSASSDTVLAKKGDVDSPTSSISLKAEMFADNKHHSLICDDEGFSASDQDAANAETPFDTSSQPSDEPCDAMQSTSADPPSDKVANPSQDSHMVNRDQVERMTAHTDELINPLSSEEIAPANDVSLAPTLKKSERASEKTVELVRKLSRKGRPPLIRPKAENHAKEHVNIEMLKESMSTNEDMTVSQGDGTQQAIAATASAVSSGHLLRRGKRSFKPAILTSKAESGLDTQKEPEDHAETAEEGGQNGVLLRRDRRPMIKPKAVVPSNEKVVSNNNASRNNTATDSNPAELASTKSKKSVETVLSPPCKKPAPQSTESSEPVTLKRPKPLSRLSRSSSKQ
ncbi:unnamed protein product [Cylicocyclus nassatus]|uniref:B-related factor 1 n=1 Tax=Cylicocyclus nassatus TaxID=53992 RepID=A0AA36H5W3_CYLNA|nr:unnamed protein product [Cylicocyclus nassatus]